LRNTHAIVKQVTMDYGTLRVATPDGQIREYPITTPSVVIGRADGNQVVIDHVSVSRRHASMVIESGRVTIEDLGSNTGVFVGGQRIPSGTVTLVESGQMMRFGDVEARFMLAEALRPEAPTAAAMADAGEEQTIGVALTSPGAAVSAGSPTTATVLVQNRGTVVDELSIAIVDLPEGWARVSRPSLSLVPGARDEITVVLSPPRESASSAGEHEFSVAVTSKATGREVRALGRFTIQPFDAFKLALDRTRSNGAYKVVVANAGNTPASYRLSAADGDNELECALAETEVALQPGEEKRLDLAVKPRSQKLFGRPTNKVFRVEGKQVNGQQSATADATVAIKPPLEPYRLPAAGVLVLGLLGGGAFTYNRQCESWGLPGCSDDSSSPAVITPTAAPATTTASPTAPAPTGLRVGGPAAIANSDPNPPRNDNCLAVRSGETPALDPANILGRLCTGTQVTLKAGPVQADNYVWWQVEGNGLTGWAAEKSVDGANGPFIVPVD